MLTSLLQHFMPSFSAPRNNLKQQREDGLGWTMQQLADFARRNNIQLSTKTLGRVESGSGRFAKVTFTRILRAVNLARTRGGLTALEEADLFPTIRPGN